MVAAAALAAELRIACVNEVTVLGAAQRFRFVVELDLEVLSDEGDDVSFTMLSTEYKRLFVREDTMEPLPLEDCVDDLDMEYGMAPRE